VRRGSQWVVVDIRLAHRADLPRIVAVYNASIPSRQATADTAPVTVEQRGAWFDRHMPDRRPLWVVEREGKVVGWLSLSDFYGRPAYHATVEMSLYIDPRYRRQGLGLGLVEYAVEHAPALGIRTLLALVFAHNQASLKLLMNLCGFTCWGNLPRVAELDGAEKDVLILGRRV